MGLLDRFLNTSRIDDEYDDDDEFLDDDEDYEDEYDDDEYYDRPKKKGFFSRILKLGRQNDEYDDEDDDDYEDSDSFRQSARESDSSRRRASSSRSSAYDSASDAKNKRGSQRFSENSARYQDRSGYEDRSRGSASVNRTRDQRSSAYGRPSGETARSRTSASFERFNERERNKSSYTAGREQTSSRKKVTPIHSRSAASEPGVSIIRPKSFDDAREIVDTLMNNTPVVLNLEGLELDKAQRIIDFACGACYSLNGNLKTISSYIFILTPHGVSISGDYQSIFQGTFNASGMGSLY